MNSDQNLPMAARPAAPPPFWEYVLNDWLEMRAGMPRDERRLLIRMLRQNLSAGEIVPLPAFFLGDQAVLCLEEIPSGTCWVFHRKSGRLEAWKSFRECLLADKI